ncbi:hypothetical protein JTB14_035112 [Gonioctena quinquepunctata]|nr:hypothetical protein JTB14_035112 [Gonioctena quinquepunctata]
MSAVNECPEPRQKDGETQTAETWQVLLNRKWKKSLPFVISQSKTGWKIDETYLLFLFVSVLILITSLILIGMSIWSLIRKIPYYYLLDIKVDLPYFTLPAGVLGILTFWVAGPGPIQKQSNSSRNLLLVIFLPILSTMTLITGSVIGLMYQAKIDNTTSRLFASMTNEYLCPSLRTSFLETNVSAAYKNAWDKTQMQLECCGISGCGDWLKIGVAIPSSCCREVTQCTPKNAFSRGCLDALSRDLVSQKHLLICHAQMTMIPQIIVVLLALTIYFLERNRKK